MAAPKLQRLAQVMGFRSGDVRDDDVPSISNTDLFIESEPTVQEFLSELAPSTRDVGRYVYKLFPFIHWISKYNWTWFIGDLVAGRLTCLLARYIFLAWVREDC